MDFKSTFDLAIHMLKKRKAYEGDEDNLDTSLIKTIRSFRNKLDKDIFISFTSCNYDTYISKIGGYYVVSTCNNTDWELEDFAIYPVISELKNLGIDDHESLEYYYKHYEFWYPQYHLIGRVFEDENDSFKSCSVHSYQYNHIVVKNPIVLKNLKSVCPDCYKQKYELLKLVSLEEYDL